MVLTIWLLIWLQTSFESRHITGDSMSPTLVVGDRLIFDTGVYRQGRAFRRGEIILFFPPAVRVDPIHIGNSFLAMLDRGFAPPSLHYPKTSIKRVIGLPGETVEVTRDGVTINGSRLDESYVDKKQDYELRELKDMGGQLLSTQGAIYPYPGKEGKIVVPQDSLFVLGDNRAHSEDSHIWGFLKQEKVIGKAVFIYYPRFGPI